VTGRRRAQAAAEGPLRVVSYCRVSTSEQADSGAGLAAQRAAISAAATARGWQIVADCEDAGLSASTLNRPALTAALEDVESGRADAIVVAKLDRLSRSMLDFASLMERSRRQGWGLVALDLGVDTSTPAGEMMMNVLASFAQFERRLIGQRTADALAVKRAQGVKLGRPRALPDAVVARIVRERSAGLTFAAIAEGLNADGIPTALGRARWWPESARQVWGYAEIG